MLQQERWESNRKLSKDEKSGEGYGLWPMRRGVLRAIASAAEGRLKKYFPRALKPNELLPSLYRPKPVPFTQPQGLDLILGQFLKTRVGFQCDAAGNCERGVMP